MNIRHLFLQTFCSLMFLVFFGCKSSPAKLYVAESSLSPRDLIMRTHPCMKQFHVHEPWLPEGYCRVDIFAIIENLTNDELLVGREQFSNGYYSIEIMLRTMDGKVYSLEKADATWYRNLQEYLIIPPHRMLCWPISLESSHWKGMPKLKPTIDDFLSSHDVIVGEDGSFVLPPEVLVAIAQNVEIQVKVVFKGLMDSHHLQICDKIESDWANIMFGDIRSKVFVPDNSEAKE